MTTIAVIGLGAMGRPMAGRLLGAGNDVVVWNRTADKAKPLVDRGAIPADSPADAVRRAEAAIVMVADPPALRDVTEGPRGIAAGVDESTAVIQMSTVGPEAVRWLASALPSGTPLVDAPVLGSIREAESGSLRIYVSGGPALVERWTPLLSVLGDPIAVGPLGAGSAAKLVANSTLIGVIGVLGEALALGRALGLPRETTFEVLSTTALAQQADRRRPAVETGDYAPRFALRLARKDADLVVDAAQGSGLDLRIAEAGQAWLRAAEEAGLGDQDYSALLRHIIDSV